MIRQDLTWQDDALCAQIGGWLWFPEKGESTRDPKAVCRECPVRTECLEYALVNGEYHGIWGALSAQELVRLRNDTTEGAA
jgi:WhiB family redox-sensing transcriptional regulator